MTPLASLQRMISSASAILMAMGFSMMTFTPASMQSRAIWAWRPLSVAMLASVRSLSASICR